MFANTNGVYKANLRMTYRLEGGEKLSDVLKEYIHFHWDFSVLITRSTYTSNGGVLEIQVERAYTNQFDFAQFISKVFIDQFKRRVEFVVGLLKLPTLYWNPQFNFSVDNCEKNSGYTDLQINHGGVFYHNPEPPSNNPVSVYMSKGCD